MASLRDIKLRIRSVKSTQKITKAMEMIAASKMKRAQQQALKGRPYLHKLSEVIGNLLRLNDPPLHHPLLEKRAEVKNVGYVFITANRGLCAGFNTNVIRTMVEILYKKNNTQEIVLTVGRKGRQAMERIGKNILADFEMMSDKPTFLDTVGISTVMIEDFLAGKLDEVYMVYNHFYSAASQKPVVRKLLPIEMDSESFNLQKVASDFKKETDKNPHSTDYIFEPNKQLLLNEMLYRYVETMVYQTVLESTASEHSARMMAMHQASENAHEIVETLTLNYNKVRQAKITTQILEVVAGSNA